MRDNDFRQALDESHPSSSLSVTSSDSDGLATLGEFSRTSRNEETLVIEMVHE